MARLSTVTPAGRPHIVPVTFAVDEDYIYTAVDAKPKTQTGAGGLQRLRNIEANPQVAMLADHYADDWTSLWWVRADGEATIVTQPRLAATPIALLAARYPQYRGATRTPLTGPVITIRVERWTGWAAMPPG